MVSLMILVAKQCTNKLLNAVLDQSREIRGKCLVRKREELQQQLNYGASLSAEDVKLITSEIESISRQNLRLDLVPETELLKVPHSAVDWHRISFDYVGLIRSVDYPLELQSYLCLVSKIALC